MRRIGALAPRVEGIRLGAAITIRRGRAEKMRQVTSSLNTAGSRASDQRAVWYAIARKSARFSASSDTCAMSAVFEK